MIQGNKVISFFDKAVFYLLCGYALTICIPDFFDSFFSRTALYLSVVRLILKRPDIKIRTYHIKVILFFLLAMLLSVFFNDVSSDYIQGLRYLRSRYLVDIFPLFLVTFFIKEGNKAKVLILCLMISFCITNLYGINEALRGISRVKGLTIHVLDLAGILILLYPASLILSGTSGIYQKYKWIFVVTTILATPVIFFNMSRVTWIVLGLMIPLIMYEFIKIKWKFWIGIIVFICAFFSVIFSNEVYYARFNSLSDMKYQSNSERLLMWKSAINMFSDHPIFGVGLGNYKAQYQERYILPEAAEPYQGNAHNNILQMLAENGIVGAIAYFVMFGYFAYESYFRWRRQKSLEAFIFFIATTGLLMQGLTDVNLYWKPSTMRSYWLLLSVYLVLITPIQNNSILKRI